MKNINIKTLIQMREWIQEQIAIYTIRKKPIKELRELLVKVTAKMLELEKDGEADAVINK